MPFYEVRRYKVMPGRMGDWLEIWEREIVPFMIARGMVICGSFVGDEDADTYVWLRRFESQEHSLALHDAVYESDEWKRGFLPRLIGIIDPTGREVTRVVPTARSTMQ